MIEIWKFLRPTIKKVFLTLIIWLILWSISYFFIAKCFFAECMSKGEMASCCNSTEGKIAEILYMIRVSFPVIAYLFSCKFTKSS